MDTFGVSGYVYKDVFLMFDRATTSLWYPFDDKRWTAVAGKRKGETIPLIEKPLVSLGEWRSQHPSTKVLLGSRRSVEASKKATSKSQD